jgi:hypothetical protein
MKTQSTRLNDARFFFEISIAGNHTGRGEHQGQRGIFGGFTDQLRQGEVYKKRLILQ